MAQKIKTKNEPVKSTLPSYEKYIDDNNKTYLKEFMALVSVPSMSSIPANKPDIEETTDWILNKLKAIGMTTAQTIPTVELLIGQQNTKYKCNTRYLATH